MNIISREQAKNNKLNRYFIAVECDAGHIVERLVSTGNCTECIKIYNQQYRNSEKGKQARNRYNSSEKCKQTHKRFMDTDRGKKIHKNNNKRYAKTENGYQVCRKTDAKHKKNNPDKVNARTALRQANKIKACPDWANLTKIQEFYTEASELTKELNERYEVDHIIPLNGKTVCGLHCEQNLQVLTKHENCVKSNILLENCSGK